MTYTYQDLKKAFMAGFNASGEGFNGEYGANPEAIKAQMTKDLAAITKAVKVKAKKEAERPPFQPL